jgi:hypothetical protein
MWLSGNPASHSPVPTLSPKDGEKSLPRAKPRGWGTQVEESCRKGGPGAAHRDPVSAGK